MRDGTDLLARLRTLEDRERIRATLAELAFSMDVQDFDLLADLFEPGAVVDHSHQSWSGWSDEIWRGQPAVMAGMQAGISRHLASQHLVTNEMIALDGDRARALAHLHSVHVDDGDHPDEHADHGAWYLVELARSSDGRWRIAWLKHLAIWYAAGMRPDGPTTRRIAEEARAFLGRGDPGPHT